MQVQAAPNVTFSPLEPLPKKIAFLEAHERGGGGTPRKNLSGLAGPPLVAKMLIGTGTRYDPKGQPLADVWEQRLGTVGKELCSSSKARNIKEGISN